ncbi:sensor histidine kinase [Dokdonia sp. Hel_I_53]|uniref:sensor histidine kinase n=1 Tax=Dokdonia sp. Hel_I_53 TaxID=1566287 RepID=UPI00119A8BBB|nr:GAF domain-containing sensor histidine kinase [Dokdonia sp. Hel_I_53]TVZ53037.1 GAF sensor signal transduction histidine kinase [Dokdonia sp. Hel_I_53]
MIAPEIPHNEQERLSSLFSYKILDTLPEEEFDAITKLASEICNTPISLITLVDENRQWFKSSIGLDVDQTSREDAFCAHGILEPHQPLIVNNALEDERFFDNPLVTGKPNVEFYAGIPLVTNDGFALGSLCVIDNNPRKLEESKIEALKILAKQIVKLFELRKAVKELEETKKELQRSIESSNDFAHIVAHDIQAPVRNMGVFANIILDDYNDVLDKEGKEILTLLSDNANSAREYVDGVLRYSRATYNAPNVKDNIDLNQFFDKILELIKVPGHITIHMQDNMPSIRTSKIALQQVMNNLLSNAVKYNDKKEGFIKIVITQDDQSNHISIIDNGRGIPNHMLDKIFNIFVMVDDGDAIKKGSSGIGLSIVKKIVSKMNGVVSVQSKANEGSTFTVSLPRS